MGSHFSQSDYDELVHNPTCTYTRTVRGDVLTFTGKEDTSNDTCYAPAGHKGSFLSSKTFTLVNPTTEMFDWDTGTPFN